MMINKIIPSVDYNKWLKCLDTQANEPNKNFIKAPEFVEPTNT